MVCSSSCYKRHSHPLTTLWCSNSTCLSFLKAAPTCTSLLEEPSFIIFWNIFGYFYHSMPHLQIQINFRQHFPGRKVGNTLTKVEIMKHQNISCTHKGCCLSGCDIMQSCRSVLVFQRILFPPSSRKMWILTRIQSITSHEADIFTVPTIKKPISQMSEIFNTKVLFQFNIIITALIFCWKFHCKHTCTFTYMYKSYICVYNV